MQETSAFVINTMHLTNQKDYLADDNGSYRESGKSKVTYTLKNGSVVRVESYIGSSSFSKTLKLGDIKPLLS